MSVVVGKINIRRGPRITATRVRVAITERGAKPEGHAIDDPDGRSASIR